MIEKRLNSLNFNVVLIADRTFIKGDEVDIKGNFLEQISDEYFETVFGGLAQVFSQVFHYNDLAQFIDNIGQHKRDIVFTIYGGANSRNRMALVPAVCEAYQIKFVGADAYARIVCQDKFLSKVLARRFNIKSPESILVDDEVNETLLKELKLPLIIKPNLEGSSIGIDASSKVASYSEANRLIKRLRLQFRQPILVEEFVAGKEVCICLVGSPNNVSLFRAMEVYDPNESDFLINNVYSGWEKHKSERIYKHRDVTNELSLDEQVSIKALFCSLGKMDFMRIDGRLNNNGFTLIELTPDAYIGKSSAIADAALQSNLSYKQLLWNIIQTALENYHIPYSNYKEN